MAVHARLKNEFTEDEKYHNLMTLLNTVMYPKHADRMANSVDPDSPEMDDSQPPDCAVL